MGDPGLGGGEEMKEGVRKRTRGGERGRVGGRGREREGGREE